jgi:hypothetical protein
MPSLFDASNFSFKPPIRSTFPVKLSSPVIAKFLMIGWFLASDINAEAIAIPPLGPSF